MRAQRLQKPNMKSMKRSFYCSMSVISVLYFFIIELSVLVVLVLHYEGMLENVMMQTFVCYRKYPVKCRACVSKKIVIAVLGNTPIYGEPLIRISRHLVEKCLTN